MKAKTNVKFADEEKKMVDAAIGLMLFGLGVTLMVLGLISIVSSAVLSGYFYSAATTTPSTYIYPLFEVIIGIVVFAFSMWVFRSRV